MSWSFLYSKVPPERYTLFLRGNFLVLAGYLIASIETYLAIYFGLTVLNYKTTFYISLPILVLTSVLISITYFKKNLLVWHEFTIFGIYLTTFLFAFCLWVYGLGGLRILGILNALTAVTIVLSYTNVIQSLLMSFSTLVCYYSITWYAIKFAGQAGSLAKETFLSFCLFPAFLLISMAAYYINNRRHELQQIKQKLEKMNLTLSAANKKLKKEHLLSDIEMDLASEIQRAIFPSKTPSVNDWNINFFTKPFGAVSGDFYDFYSSNNSLDGLALFDVSGHGVAPALITILAKPVLYHHFKQFEFSKLGDVIEAANEELMEELEEVNLYITGLLLRIHNNEVEYVNAGHPDLLHFNSKTGFINPIEDNHGLFKGHPIGISSVSQRYQSHKFKVSTGDFLIIYSDGLIESKNYMGEQFGILRLSDAIVSAYGGDANAILKSIMDSFNTFTGHIKPGDDITIIIAEKI